MQKIIEYALAKVNLSLYVTGVISNMHTLEMVNIPIPFYDIFEIEESEKDIFYSNVYIKDNLVLKTLDLWRQFTKIYTCVKINLTKNIPLGSGLAGGSADCGALIRALNRLFMIDKPLEDFINLAIMIGSDVPFCLFNKEAYVTHLGENIKFLNKSPHIKSIVLVFPDVQTSTKLVFCNFDGPYKSNPKLALAYNDDFKYFLKYRKNFLTSTTLKLYPQLQEFNNYKRLMMSGSGATFYIINPRKKDMDYIENLPDKHLFLKI
jgi:4-diphosphocytidyl-2-C-methyl-D-erythritol kinase